MTIDIKEIKQILDAELSELKAPPYVVEFNRYKEEISNEIRQRELALEKFESLTQSKINQYTKNCNAEGMV